MEPRRRQIELLRYESEGLGLLGWGSVTVMEKRERSFGESLLRGLNRIL
jgi:hypothetical protein